MRSSQSSRFMHLSDRTTPVDADQVWPPKLTCSLCSRCSFEFTSRSWNMLKHPTDKSCKKESDTISVSFKLWKFWKCEAVQIVFCDRDSEIWIPFCHDSDNLRWRWSYHDLDCISDILLLAACAHITFPHLLLYASCIVIKAVQIHSIIHNSVSLVGCTMLA